MAITPGKWVLIGPARIDDGGLGTIGRIHSIAIDPTAPTTMYVGAPHAGIWKTTNGGADWTPVDAECDLVGDCRIMAILARPLLQDQSDCVLEHEGPAEMNVFNAALARPVSSLGKYSARWHN